MTAPITPATAPLSWWKTPVPWAMLGSLIVAIVTLFNPTWVDAHHLSGGVQAAAVGLAALVNLAGIVHHFQWHNAIGLLTPVTLTAVETDIGSIATAVSSGDPTKIIEAVGKAMTDLAGIVAPLVPVSALPAIAGAPPPPGPAAQQAA